jgi:hypothetical protein
MLGFPALVELGDWNLARTEKQFNSIEKSLVVFVTNVLDP